MAAAHCVALSANESLSAWMKALPRRRTVAAFRTMVGSYVTRARFVSPARVWGSRAGLHRVGKEKLRAVDFVVGDRFLAFGRNHPVHEHLAKLLLDARVLVRVYQHHTVLVE